ncbi:MAG TPA: hypothetical protein VFN68_15850 [Acidimicrobiales bacterium]|nr:hypothetical protein [Acidimicrobiales bacterium]
MAVITDVDLTAAVILRGAPGDSPYSRGEPSAMLQAGRRRQSPPGE